MNIKRFTIMLCVLFTVASCAPATTWRGTAIKRELAATPGIAGHEIFIDERPGGLIVLSGRVSSFDDRATIERIARNTRGVREVRNNIVVSSPLAYETGRISEYDRRFSRASDSRGVVSEIIDKIASSHEMQDYNLNVGVIDGTAVLRGQVGSERERLAAERLARNTSGVSIVRNELRVSHAYRNDEDITQEVRDVLSRHPDIDISNMQISTRDGIVTISGPQESSRDIDRILSIALMVDGVRDIDSELYISGSRPGSRYSYRYGEEY